MAKINIASLIDAGVHFGHQTRRWNPKMKPYIFTSRKGIYIIDLKQTLRELDKAYSFIKELTKEGGSVLFVGTKKQAQEPVLHAAEKCGMPYVNNRWLGGMLTNFVTIRSRVTYMEELESMEEDGRMAALPKKEQVLLRKKLGKLQANLNGVRDMTRIPQAIFVVDTKREEIAVTEARRLNIPVIGILDTNADPDEVSYGIPGNDDAIRSVGLIANLIADAAVAGSSAALVSEAEMAQSEPVAEPIVTYDFRVSAPAPVATDVEPAAEPEQSSAEPDTEAAAAVPAQQDPETVLTGSAEAAERATVAEFSSEAVSEEFVAAATIEETPAEIAEDVADATKA
jgi:small subunit ribosomal protein S2